MMDQDEEVKLENITQWLIARAEQMGVSRFSVREESLSLEDSLDQEGPLTWALFLHSGIIAKMLGAKGVIPLECVTDSNSLFGNRAGLRKGGGGLSLSFSVLCLDAALEHAVVSGLRDLECTVEAWNALPYEYRVLPIEVYFEELKSRWVDDALDSGTAAEKVVRWPVLFDFASYEESMSNDHTASQVDGMKISSIMPLTPKQ